MEPQTGRHCWSSRDYVFVYASRLKLKTDYFVASEVLTCLLSSVKCNVTQWIRIVIWKICVRCRHDPFKAPAWNWPEGQRRAWGLIVLRLQDVRCVPCFMLSPNCSECWVSGWSFDARCLGHNFCYIFPLLWTCFCAVCPSLRTLSINRSRLLFRCTALLAYRL
jgi:hypothetical protein